MPLLTSCNNNFGQRIVKAEPQVILGDSGFINISRQSFEDPLDRPTSYHLLVMVFLLVFGFANFMRGLYSVDTVELI